MLPALIVERDRILVAAQGFLRQVGRIEGHALLYALFTGVPAEVFALGGKTDAERRLRQGCHPGEDVRILFELERYAAVALLELLGGAILDPIVGHRGHRYEDVAGFRR